MSKPELSELIKTSFVFLQNNYNYSASYFIAFISFAFYITFTILYIYFHVRVSDMLYRYRVGLSIPTTKQITLRIRLYSISTSIRKFFFFLMFISFMIPTILLLLPVIASLFFLLTMFTSGTLSGDYEHLYLGNNDHTSTYELPCEAVIGKINHLMEDGANDTNGRGSRNESPANQGSGSRSPNNQVPEEGSSSDGAITRRDNIGVGPHTYRTPRPGIPLWRYDEDIRGLPNFIRDTLYGPNGVPDPLTDDLAMAQLHLERMMLSTDAHEKMGYRHNNTNNYLFADYKRNIKKFNDHIHSARLLRESIRNTELHQMHTDQTHTLVSQKGITDIFAHMTFGHTNMNSRSEWER